MNANSTRQLHDLGQSLWLDNITRDLLASGTLQRYIDEWSVTGLTSNPSIFNAAIKGSSAYDQSIRDGVTAGKSGEDLFFDLALADVVAAADLFLPIHQRTAGVDGWASLEVSPLLVHDAKGTAKVASELHEKAGRPNVLIKIPGTIEGLAAIEETIFAGVPVNVTLLFSTEQCVAAAEAYLRGIERRIAADLDPNIASVASLFVSRWDVAIAGKVPPELNNKLGIAMSSRTYQAFCTMSATPRWQRAFNFGARPQRLLLASTGTKDPKASDVMYLEALAAPLTVNTIPEATLKAFADHGKVGKAMHPSGGDADAVIGAIRAAGIDVEALAMRLQDEGGASFSKSWAELLDMIESKSALVGKAT